MKQLAALIKEQIQQLKNEPLSEWLLSHFREDAHTLDELFAERQEVSGAHEEPIFPLLPAQQLFFSLPLFIFNTYAPASLRQEFARHFLASTELIPEEPSSVDPLMNRELSEQLADYKAAWPIIMALYQQGCSDLLQILNQADEASLRALMRFARGSDLTSLVETFLAHNSSELELINRHRLIQFLRQPDLSGWLLEFLEALVCQASNVISLKLLILILKPENNEFSKRQEIRTFLAQYPFAIHLETLRAVIYFYSDELQTKPYSPVSQSFLSLLHDLMMRMDTAGQRELMARLDQERLLFIIDLCLRGCASSDELLQQECKFLLLLLCSESLVADKHRLALIKTRLARADTYLLGDDPYLLALAKEVQDSAVSVEFPTRSNTAEHVAHGLWIEQLLTSPRFVAACTAREIQQLCDRYHLLSVTLTRREYSLLIASFKDELPYEGEIQKNLGRVSHHEAHHPEAKEYWLNKRSHLHSFIRDSVIHALLIRLDRACDEGKSQNLVMAEKALETLYSYYNQTIPRLRPDLLFRAINYAYSPWMRDMGYLLSHQSVLLSWLQQYLPAYTTSFISLQRKKEVKLHDLAGEELGFLNEFNEALTFIEAEVVLLIDTDAVKANEPVYDKQGTLLGYLTETGHMRSADLLQKNVSAQLLARVPQTELALSPDGLSLLVRHTLYEESLDVLYEADSVGKGSAKHLWLEEQISAAIRDCEQNLSSVIFNSVVTHHNDKAVFSLLAFLRHKDNAILLFHNILNHDEQRERLFQGEFKEEAQQFLDKQGLVQCLAYYMANFHNKPWFADGLAYFARCAKKQKKEHLLADALDLLANEMKAKQLDDVVNALVSSEATAQVLLQELLNDRAHLAVQQIKSTEIERVIQHFGQKQLVVALRTLNKLSQWENSSLYKLVLHSLNNNYEQLFEVRGAHYIATSSWQSDELNELACFISQHLEKKSTLDCDGIIGYKVLGELIFRSAYAGQISSFYREKQFNPGIARLSFTRPFLEQLVDKFWIPEGVKEQFADTIERIKSWSDEQSPLQKEVGGYRVLIDWRHLIKQTWNEIQKKKLPIICAYLLNYSGAKKPLAFLLRDYINAFQDVPDYLYPVVRLLKQFPQRDVSAVVFDVLEAMALKNPRLLDKTVLQCMAYYYTKKNAILENESPLAELHLLTYFGQNKKYALVHAGCNELLETCDDQGVKAKLTKGAYEARIEADLSLSLGYFHFGLIKFFKRLWHYGFNAKNNSSGIVAFCEDNEPPPRIVRSGEEVSVPASCAKVSVAYLEFTEKRRQLINLLATIRHCPAPVSLMTRPSQSGQSLFSSKGLTEESVVVKEQTAVPM
ncbi:hypothetical protein [Legionella fallonii]|uniref:Dot/Icm T4SS effector n=1 Tax=Legionella fallonii LLAP-10 TaxID=1212491 RepID=A0A098FZF3_9GAMM|nr:hypothetical protein [Legionella fallonii]CEG55597.1 conserved protein of unknown function [Legionella fallonii LLAP-10]